MTLDADSCIAWNMRTFIWNGSHSVLLENTYTGSDHGAVYSVRIHAWCWKLEKYPHFKTLSNVRFPRTRCYFQQIFRKQILKQIKFNFKWDSRKCIWKCRLQNVSPIFFFTFQRQNPQVKNWWRDENHVSCHYNDVIMSLIESQITSLTVVYSAVYSDADQRKRQSAVWLAFVWGIHRYRWIPRTKGQLRGKCFHLMTSSCMDVSLAFMGTFWWLAYW